MTGSFNMYRRWRVSENPIGYVPELGQMVFGQPSQSYESPQYLDAALSYLRYEVTRVLWNLHQEDRDPFGNTGEQFDCDGVFRVEAYSWNEEVAQPWNFKCGDLEVSWYKYLGRGMSVNKAVTPDEVAAMLRLCMDAVGAYEKAHSGASHD